MQDAFGKGDVWVAFTQQSYWQMYNGELSRPFRELNYEPELIFTYPLNFSAGNLKMKMIGLSVNHQSNGKEAAHSRSWNRIILSGIFLWNDLMVNSRFWWRFSEKAREDDNPDIENYIGRCELSIAYPFRKNVFNLKVRNNLSFNHNRGHVELNWIYPLSRDLRILLQASHGYGDFLIDYNYKQTIVGREDVSDELVSVMRQVGLEDLSLELGEQRAATYLHRLYDRFPTGLFLFRRTT